MTTPRVATEPVLPTMNLDGSRRWLRPVLTPGRFWRARRLVAYALMVAALVLLSRIAGFAWSTFVRLFRWALLAYVVMSGMIEFAFIHDHTRGTTLTEVTLMLVIFALSVPTTIAFTSARYADT